MKFNKLISLSLFQMKVIFTHTLHRKNRLSFRISLATYTLIGILA